MYYWDSLNGVTSDSLTQLVRLSSLNNEPLAFSTT